MGVRGWGRGAYLLSCMAVAAGPKGGGEGLTRATIKVAIVWHNILSFRGFMHDAALPGLTNSNTPDKLPNVLRYIQVFRLVVVFLGVFVFYRPHEGVDPTQPQP